MAKKLMVEREAVNAAALLELKSMKHRDLQRSCVIRGLPFTEVVRKTDPQLSNWFLDNYIVTQIPDLLDEFDKWREEEIKAYSTRNGIEYKPTHPMLRLGYVGEPDEETGEVVIQKPKAIKKPKKGKRERDESSGIFKGTKKALTFKLTEEGMELKEIFKEVQKSFPEAVEKSMKIWHKTALKNQAEKKKK